MTSKRISALILLLLIFGVLFAVIVNSKLEDNKFPKYNRFYYMEEYMTDIEDFVKENFPMAGSLKNGAVKLQLLLGKKEHDDMFIGNDILIDFIVKTSNQIAILHDKYAFAVDSLRLNLTR